MVSRAFLPFLVAGVALGQTSSSYHSNATFLTEQEAVQKAAQLDVGRAELIGADTAVVGAFGEFTLRFTVGRAGMQTGGGLRIATAHDFGWDMWGGARLQTDDPKAANYLVYRTSTGAELAWKFWPQGGKESLFREFHPWQTINEFTLKGAPMKQGDWIEIVFGSRTAGSPGVEIQPMDETAFEQKVYVDAEGKGEFLPLGQSPTMRIFSGEAKQMLVIAKTDWVVGEPGWVSIWFDDGFGNPADYRGAVDLVAEPGASQLRESWSFSQGDKGAHRFENVRFTQPGVYRVRATTRDGKGAVSNPFVVHEARPAESIVWGDIHTHTKYSDGRGTPDEMYEFARNYSSIDFCAVSDHAFTTTDWMWDDLQRAAKQYNEPGRFVTFLGYEWSGTTDVGGDHNVYTTADSMPLYRSYTGYNYRNLRMYHGPNKMAGHVEDLFRLMGENFRDENLLTIPHYGGRPGNPEWHNPELQRGIEVFSDHRRSENWMSTFLEKGYRIGIVASTDNHSGNAGYGVRREEREIGEDRDTFSRFSPAERGTALMAVYTESLDREDVFQGIYHRRTYATTGSRIILRFWVNGLPMGSEGKQTGAPVIRVSAVGTAGLKGVRIVRNGKIIHAVDPPGDSADFEYVDRSGETGPAYYYVDLLQDDGEKAISSPVWLD
jgi:hypothetical protein